MPDDPNAPGLTEPLSVVVRSMLRTATVEHLRDERRRLFPARLHVGTPGASRLSASIPEAPSEFGTRVDLIHAMAREAERSGVATPTGVPWVWLTRSGAAVPDHLDFSFLAPALHAYAEVSQPLTFFVVTRRGWHDPRSGLHRTWSRLRAA